MLTSRSHRVVSSSSRQYTCKMVSHILAPTTTFRLISPMFASLVLAVPATAVRGCESGPPIWPAQLVIVQRKVPDDDSGNATTTTYYDWIRQVCDCDHSRPTLRLRTGHVPCRHPQLACVCACMRGCLQSSCPSCCPIKLSLSCTHFASCVKQANLIQITSDDSPADVLWDLELGNKSSYYFTPNLRSCQTMSFPVGILRPDWLANATCMGPRTVLGRKTIGWTKADFIDYYADGTRIGACSILWR